MIVVWGPPREGTLQAVRDALARRRAPFAFVNQADVLDQAVRIAVGDCLQASIELPDGGLDLQGVDAVYVRPYSSADAPAVTAHGPDSAALRYAWRVDEMLNAWADVTPALVLNRPSAMLSNNSKPYQAESARRAGFKVPETLITTDPEAVREFAAHHGAIVYKSISSVRSIVTRLRPEDIARLDDVQWCPTQFQARVPGTDFRVHVVGACVFACEIESDADDYRYGGYVPRPCDLPADIAVRCVQLAADLGLELTGIDLRRTPDGAWYCFEANPSPAFVCFGEQHAGIVADAVAAHLLAGVASRQPSGRVAAAG